MVYPRYIPSISHSAMLAVCELSRSHRWVCSIPNVHNKQVSVWYIQGTLQAGECVIYPKYIIGRWVCGIPRVHYRLVSVWYTQGTSRWVCGIPKVQAGECVVYPRYKQVSVWYTQGTSRCVCVCGIPKVHSKRQSFSNACNLPACWITGDNCVVFQMLKAPLQCSWKTKCVCVSVFIMALWNQACSPPAVLTQLCHSACSVFC